MDGLRRSGLGLGLCVRLLIVRLHCCNSYYVETEIFKCNTNSREKQ